MNETLRASGGVFVIDKPADWTSHDVVARIRNILKTRRVGHTGTLDPFATGVLVVCVNRATRLVRFLTGEDKEYLATVKFGFATDTGDLTGNPEGDASSAVHITPEMVNEALKSFIGPIKQIPPMYSAKKIEGVRLYELARRGKEIERKPIDINIHEIELLGEDKQDQLEELNKATRSYQIRVLCSSGTYIRTLAEDIGKQLGVGAHLTELRRLRAGKCSLNHAVSIEKLEELSKTGRTKEVMIEPAQVLTMGEIHLIEDERLAVIDGRPISHQGGWKMGCFIKLCDSEGNLVAVAEFDNHKNLLRPRVVLQSR